MTKRNQKITPRDCLAFDAMIIKQNNRARAWIDNNTKLLKFAQALNLNIALRIGLNDCVDGEILNVNKDTSVIKIQENLTNHIYRFRSDSIVPDSFYFAPKIKKLWIYINSNYQVTTEEE